jgi:peptide/nickel transport system permease protein
MKNKMLGARLAGAFLLLIGVISIFSDFLSTNPPEQQNLGRFYAPPTRIHFVDANGKLYWQPFVLGSELIDPLDIKYEERPSQEYPLQFFSKGYPYRFLGIMPMDRHLVACANDKSFYPLGTDELGRDMFARVLAGAHTSLLTVLVGLAFYGLLGLAIGMLSGYSGGWIDSLLMRMSEFVLALPALYLILALRALLPMKMSSWQTVLLTAGIIAAVAWPPMARGIRGLLVQLRKAAFVDAARALGCTPWQILMRHLLPAMLPFAVTQMALAAPVFLFGEVVLSFLGVGFQDGNESWGSMLRNLKDPRILSGFWWNLAPLAIVFATLFCLNLISSGTRAKSADVQVMRI